MTAAPAPALRSENPLTGEVLGEVPVAGARQVAAAVTRARAAAPQWAAADPAERAAVLERFADLVDASADELADLVVAEVGKRRAEAVGEIGWASLTARWYAAPPPAPERVAGAVVRRLPLGVVAAITPWNVPVTTPAWKWLPALMAGNAVVWKPSELAPLTAVAVARLWRAAALPDGLLEILHGDGTVGRALVDDPGIDGIHFTGSTATGRSIAVAAAGRLVRCALELGGLNPVIVFDDADLDQALDDIIAAGTAINGQKCTATRRVLVAEPVARQLLDALAARVAGLTAGDPADSDTDLGPLVTRHAADEARTRVAASVAAGARVVAHSPIPDHPGFFPVTVLGSVAPGDGLRTRELFAPVIAVETFDGEDEAWTAANATPYGLAASIHTRDERRWADAPRHLRAGIVNVNRRGDAVDLEAPFGGLKASGNGYPEGGLFVYDSLTTHQACYIRDQEGTR